MTIQGLRDTNNFIADQRPKNWREGIMLLYPNGRAPLFALSSMMKSESSDDPEFSWFEKLMATKRMELNGDHTNSVDPLTVVSGGLEVKVGDLIYIEETGELVLVDGTTTATSIPIERSYGSVAGTAVPAGTGAGTNPFITVVGSIFAEGSLAPAGVSRDPTKVNNFMQIFRDTYQITGTAVETNLRTGSEVVEQKRETLEMHMQGIERAFWFGEKKEDLSGSTPKRSTAGIESLLPASQVSDRSGAAVQMVMLEEDLKTAFDFGSSEKIGFCGNRALLTINQIIRKNSAMQITPGIKEFGMNVSRLVTPFGELVLKTHPLFNQMGGGTNTQATGTFKSRDGWLFIMDMTNVKYRYMRNRDTKFQPRLETPGEDAVKAGFLTEGALELRHATTHFLIKGLDSAAVDA